MALLAPTNHLRMECEKSQLNNSFESILDEDVPYSIVVKNITAEETRDMFKVFAVHFFMFFYIFIQYALSEKAWSSIFLLIQKQPPELFCEKNLEISQNSQENTCAQSILNKVAGLSLQLY